MPPLSFVAMQRVKSSFLQLVEMDSSLEPEDQGSTRVRRVQARVTQWLSCLNEFLIGDGSLVGLALMRPEAGSWLWMLTLGILLFLAASTIFIFSLQVSGVVTRISLSCLSFLCQAHCLACSEN